MVAVPRHVKRRLFATLLVALLALAALVGLLLQEILKGKETLLQTARQENLVRSKALGREVEREFDKVDVLLRAIASDIQPVIAHAAEPKTQAETNRRLAERWSFLPEVQSIRVADATGHFVFDAAGTLSTTTIADRPYFLTQKSEHANLVISAPVFARITKNWVVVLSRPITSEDGRFLGLVQAAVNTDHFQTLLKNHQHSEKDVLTILGGQQYIVLARQPGLAEHIGQPLPIGMLYDHLQGNVEVGAYEGSSALDQVYRSAAFVRHANTGLIFVYAQNLKEVLAPWREKVMFYSAGVILLLLALVGIFLSWRRGYLAALETAASMQDHAFREAARLHALIDSLPDLIWFKGTDLKFQAANKAFATMVGREPEDIIEADAEVLYPPMLAAEVIAQDRLVLTTGETIREEHILIDPAGYERVIDMIRVPIAGKDGEVIGVAGIGRDITDHKDSEALILHMAEHDPLTDLPNRLLLSKYVAEMMAQNPDGRERVRMAVLFVDLDEFKRINDTLGHEVGDHLLQEVSARLKRSVFDSDIVSRHGGDEFTVLLLDSASAAKTAQVAERVLTALNQPLLIDGHDLTLSASIGIALYPQDGQDLATLLRNADTAMYSAKSAGRNTYRFYTAEMNVRIAERLALENHLRKALERNELCLHFQPQVQLDSGIPLGFEALLRWQSPIHGNVPPIQFIPIAEESRLILPIGEWILREACRALVQLRQQWEQPLTMAVNISVVQFQQADLPELVRSALAEYSLPAECLELELTESLFLQDFEHAQAMMGQLKEIGVKLAIDDFGTGYSSLSYLRTLPFDTLKIDKSFIDNLSHEDGRAITETIIDLGVKMRMLVLAEGVETEGQRTYLQQQGCALAQGYLLSRPMSLQQALTWLETQERSA